MSRKPHSPFSLQRRLMLRWGQRDRSGTKATGGFLQLRGSMQALSQEVFRSDLPSASIEEPFCWAGLWAGWGQPVLPVSQGDGMQRLLCLLAPSTNAPLLFPRIAQGSDKQGLGARTAPGVCCRPRVPVGVTSLLLHGQDCRKRTQCVWCTEHWISGLGKRLQPSSSSGWLLSSAAVRKAASSQPVPG